jgi:SRSO17 transposase
MNARQLAAMEGRLEKWLALVFGGLGRRERVEALGNYLRGLLLDGERKSIDPIAQRLVKSAGEAEAMRQRLQQAVTVAAWDERIVFQRLALEAERHLPGIDAWAIDDTGFPKKGFKSVGVQRQYSGTMGRIDNCQIATSLHLASEHGGVCVGSKLYLPKDWAEDEKRRTRAGIPTEVEFKEKWRIALGLVDELLATGVKRRVVVADAGYGDCIDFRDGLAERGLHFLVGVTGTAVGWPPGVSPRPPPPKTKGGRPPTRWREPLKGKARALSDIAANLPTSAWKKVTWREGTRGPQSSRFAAVRLRTAHGHALGHPPSEELWLLCEWPRRQELPSKLYLSNLPRGTSLKKLVYLAKLRWRIERDYQEMKGEFGLDHFEGRRWSGFHHHVACVAAAHAFLALERARFPPQHPTEPLRLQETPSAGTPAGDRGLSALLSGSSAPVGPNTLADLIK